jgi:FdrA protein
MLADLVGKKDVGAILFDVILGDLAHPDPVAPLVNALQRWRPPPAGEGVPAVAVLVGARADPQGLERQRRTLEAAGIQVFASNTAAARVAGQFVAGES